MRKSAPIVAKYFAENSSRATRPKKLVLPVLLSPRSVIFTISGNSNFGLFVFALFYVYFVDEGNENA